MNIFELALEAQSVINHPVSSSMFLKMPGKWGKSDYRYLNGQKSPKGKIVQAFVGEVMVCFDAVDILAYCVANSDGQIKVAENQESGE